MGKIKKLVSLIPEKKESIIGVLGYVCYGLLAVYAFCLATPVATYVTYYETDFPVEQRVMSQFVNGLNNMVLILCIIGLLLSAAHFILRNSKRKQFYISNYIGTGIISAFSLFSSIMLFVNIASYQSRFRVLDFDYINDIMSIYPNISISPNTSVFILGFLLSGLILIYGLLQAYLIVDKYLYGKKAKNEDKEVKAVSEDTLVTEKAEK